jgi:hypothetical protein
MARLKYISKILSSEKIGDSLVKLNNNFFNIQHQLKLLKDKLDKTVHIRTFFYYGPNSKTDPTSNMQDVLTSRPSDNTIISFLIDRGQLNLRSISKKNDIAYVIYQKTGFKESHATRLVSGSVDGLSYNTSIDDYYTVFSPVFIIWKLTYNGITYSVDSGFPKFTQAETISTENWNNPNKWLTY